MKYVVYLIYSSSHPASAPQAVAVSCMIKQISAYNKDGFGHIVCGSSEFVFTTIKNEREWY